MIDKNIKDAVMRVLNARIDNSNYGMLSTARVSFGDEVLLKRAGLRVFDNRIEKDGTEVAKVHRRYAAHKRNGMYKELKPKVEWL